MAAVVSFDAGVATNINLSHETNAILSAINGIGTGAGSYIDKGINAAQGILNGGNHVVAAASVIPETELNGNGGNGDNGQGSLPLQ